MKPIYSKQIDFSDPEVFYSMLQHLVNGYSNVRIEQEIHSGTGVVITYIHHYPMERLDETITGR